MNKDMNELYAKFLAIKDQKWIKSKRKGTGGIGYTFETLLGKEEENFPVPDYKGIEIKTKHKDGFQSIKLFAIAPDGDYLFPGKRIVNILGYPDKDLPEYKVFNCDANALFYKRIGLYKRIKIKVNRLEEKIELVAINNKGDVLPIFTSWSFKMLEERINIKLKYLAIIKADTIVQNNTEYFYYNEIKFYKLKKFDDFLDAMEKGYIKVKLNYGIFKSGNRKGQIKDHGTSFMIYEKNINSIFDSIE